MSTPLIKKYTESTFHTADPPPAVEFLPFSGNPRLSDFSQYTLDFRWHKNAQYLREKPPKSASHNFRAAGRPASPIHSPHGPFQRKSR